MRERRRARLALEKPFADECWEAALGGLTLFGFLDAAQRVRLRFLATAFAREKQFVGAASYGEVSEEDRARISAMACLPILNFGLDAYRGWSSVILLPEGFTVPRSEADESGVVVEYDDDVSGLVMDSGSVALSMDDVDQAGRGSGYNVVIHEMAHKLDEGNGELDGLPWLEPRGALGRDEWARVFGAAFRDFSNALESHQRLAFRRGRRARGVRASKAARARSLLDDYAADSPPEFFAVCCEHFFETPQTLRTAYPEVYGLLSRYFGLDPARGSTSSVDSGPPPT
jgi:Mlc titration factor MtfA (ptsG expression regulator)